MDELFGAPITNIAAVLAVAFGIAVAFLLYIRVRNPILVRMAFRNVRRRPGQSLLIISGLMLATAIISSAFTVGDSVTYSIKKNAGLQSRSAPSMNWWWSWTMIRRSGRAARRPTVSPKRYLKNSPPCLTPILDVDGVLPALTQHVSVINPDSQQFDSSVLLAGLDPQRATSLR